MKTKLLSGLLLAVFAAGVVAQDEIGATVYPNATEMPEATKRLSEAKAPTWITARAYHTDARIKDVVKYFHDQAEKAKNRAGENVLLDRMLRDNWQTIKSKVSGTPTIFGISKDLRTNSADKHIEHSFGVILLDDSFVRVHLLSPHPAPADNNTLVDGTMIVMVRERIGDPSSGVSEDEVVYTGRDVTRRVRIRAKPAVEGYPNVSGTVVLKAVLTATGKVTRITVISGVPGLTERAIAAARLIEFDPAIKDGRYVSQWVQLEYHFR